MATTVAVHSFRGGTGKSNITANLAVTVARQGRRVAIVDTDIQSPGVHVLRVDAPGHRTYARRIDVHPGTRAALEVELTPEPALREARALRRAADELDIAGVEAALVSLAEAGGAVRAMPERGPIGALWLVRVSGGPIERAVVVPCDSEGCRAPLELEGSTPAEPLAALEGEPLERRGLELALSWLDEPLPEAPPPLPSDWWEEPWPWAIGGAVIGVAIAIGVGVAISEGPAEPQRVIRIEPGDACARVMCGP